MAVRFRPTSDISDCCSIYLYYLCSRSRNSYNHQRPQTDLSQWTSVHPDLLASS